MHRYTVMAGLTSKKAKAEETAAKIKQLGFNPWVKSLTGGFYAVMALETDDEAEARAARDTIDRELGAHTGLKIID